VVISRERAREIAEHFLTEEVRGSEPDVVIIDTNVVLDTIGWVFPYQTRSYIEDGSNPLAGNLPIVVDQTTGGVRYMSPEETRASPEAAG
jgi:hypothetical protein